MGLLGAERSVARLLQYISVTGFQEHAIVQNEFARVRVPDLEGDVSDGTLPGFQVRGVEVRFAVGHFLVNFEAGQRFWLLRGRGAVI